MADAPRRHDCRASGCHAPATCIPRLVVPGHKLAVRQIPAVGSVMWLPLCDKHFAQLTTRDFLKDQRIRESFQRDFRRQAVPPDFNEAWLMPVHVGEKDFKNAEFFADHAAARGENATPTLN